MMMQRFRGQNSWTITVVIAAALCFFAAHARGAEYLWVEAEAFEEPGGWINDAQFIDLMGSPYLLAIGMEGPVDDAATELEVPQAGDYKLWVRCRDWLPDHSPGRFQVKVAGQLVDHVFGSSKKHGWRWEDGGTIELPQGRIEIALHDLTGHYSRCDAILLTSDHEYIPPDDLNRLAEAREKFGGVSREVARKGPYDTVVVGGGLAGTFAAVASARMGCKTALIQNRPVLGGNGSTEILVRPEGDTTREPLDPGEGGIIEEVRGDVFGYSERLLKLVQGESNLDLFLNTHATGVVLDKPGWIAAVKALDVTTNQRYLFEGRMFIDCTGDGVIGVWAGADYRHGCEPRSMYEETRAPQQRYVNTGTMGGTLRYDTKRVPEPVSFEARPWAHQFHDCDDFGVRRHPQLQFGGWQWVIEYGGQRDTYRDAEEIRDELLRIIWGMWDHAKNHCPRLEEEAKNYQLTWVSHVVGKRESRRLLGDYIMREQDIGNQTLFPDRVSYGGWGIDIHPPGGFYAPGEPAIFSHKVKFSVPFRSLYSRNVDNLMMAGRCISVSHAALGATRVMITCGLQGQAAGTAAGFCEQHDTTPRGVYENYISDLQQQLLRDGCYIIELPNDDPHDIALTARAVNASSTAPPDSYDITKRLSEHPLNHDRAVMFKTSAERIDSVSLYLRSERESPVELTAHLRRADALGNFDADEDLATAQAVVEPQSSGWVTFRFDQTVEPGHYWVWLPKSDGLFWALYAAQPKDTARAYLGGGRWNPMPECYAFQVSPGEPIPSPLADDQWEEELFAAGNVINGFARAIRGVPNSWRPDPEAQLPQWVELDLGEKRPFNTVHVSFQSAGMRADDFSLEIPDAGQWRPVARVTDNTQRRRVIRFDRVHSDKLRLVIHKAQPEMGVCEIRIYDEP